MKKLIFITIISIFSTNCFATVNPDHLASCNAGVSGKITGLYSDTYAQKAAIKIGDSFYYLSWGTIDANVRITYDTAISAYFSGATTTIKECQGGQITSIQVGN